MKKQLGTLQDAAAGFGVNLLQFGIKLEKSVLEPINLKTIHD